MRHLEMFYPYLLSCLHREPVCVCYLDGLGWYMLEYAKKQGKVPFLAKNMEISPVRTVEPPITNTAMATIITGKKPEEHGVYSHQNSHLQVASVFSKMPQKTVFLEGDSQILWTEVLPVLHTSGEGHSGDYWIKEDTKSALKSGVPFIFSHFHEIDDIAHQWGPYHEKTLEELKKTDDYVREIAEVCQGKLLLISDHGLRACVDGGGTHGSGESEEEMTAIWGERRSRDYEN